MRKAVQRYRIRPAAELHVLTPLFDGLCALVGLGTGFRRRLTELARLERRHRALDIGCGTGSLAILIRQTHPAVRILAVDPDHGALAIAQKKAKRKQLAINFEKARAEELPFASCTFDRVLSSLAFHHIPDDHKAEALAEFRRVLGADGILILADFETTRSHLFWGKSRSRHSLEGWLRNAGFAPTTLLAVRRGVHIWQGSAPS